MRLWAKFMCTLTLELAARQILAAARLNDEALALWLNCGVEVSFPTRQSHEKAWFPVACDNYEKFFNYRVDTRALEV
jgi:hypothetical protein